MSVGTKGTDKVGVGALLTGCGWVGGTILPPQCVMVGETASPFRDDQVREHTTVQNPDKNTGRLRLRKSHRRLSPFSAAVITFPSVPHNNASQDFSLSVALIRQHH